MGKRVNLLPLVKLSFFCMLLYSSFLMEALGVKINNMTLILGVVTAMFMGLDMLNTTQGMPAVTTKDLKLLLLFLLFCLMTILFAQYPGSAINGIIQLVQNMLLLVISTYICIREGSIRFCARTVVVVMAAVTIFALQNAESFDTRLALTESSNANVFGHNAVLGFGLTFIAFEGKNKLSRIFCIGLCVLFGVGVVLSASRMSFIAALGYLVMYVLYYVPKNRQGSWVVGGMKLLFALIVAGVLVSIILPYIQDTLVAERLEELFDLYNTGDGDGQARVYLYEEAWAAFLKHPIFGLGYANFAPLHYGVYTHSTYAEILSCTGIFGGISFLSYYLHIGKELRIGARHTSGEMQKTNRQLALMFLALLLLGVGEILIYKIKYFIVFGMYAGQFYLNRQQMNAIEDKVV